ncbi:MAG: hypothetical protein H6621_03355 [Halobacteriovoraceae bacterium]|nr:hypothetical protein [Halobacteriovoraceae bacterium]MCB9094084.1 hypothetical protein [Halobacteriovoraceae bacterium]
MKTLIFIIIQFGILKTQAQSTNFHPQLPLQKALQLLGEKLPTHYLDPDPELIQKGKEIVFQGSTTDSQKRPLPEQSPVFRCFHCHNLVKENPELAVDSIDEKINFAEKFNLAILPGTTLYGTVNKTTWFAGDYIKKYGEDLIKPALHNLQEAIQLCSRECSKGRKLSDYELKAIVHYLWSIQYKLQDLNLSSGDYDFLNRSKATHSQKVNFLKSKYLQELSITFGHPPSDFKKGYGYNGNPQVGEIIFERTCLHCHNSQSIIPEITIFDPNKIKTFRALNRMKNSYQIIREGKFDEPHIYMPNFPIEKLSDKNLDDLKAYFDKRIEELMNP